VLKVAVLGAGYMGSAITFPLAARGVRVNLWGTWLDDEILDACAEGVHPKLKLPLPGGVALHRSEDLDRALDGVDAAYVAVTSEGFVPVFRKALAAMVRNVPMLALTKGFIPEGGRVSRVSEAAERMFRERFPSERLIWVSVGGPVKAVELAMGIPTATIYGSGSDEALGLAEGFETVSYRISTCADVAGVELCSALKNVYAVALGICDGMYGKMRAGSYNNHKAFVFTQGVREMGLVVEKAGGRRETVDGLAGMGDLHLTAASGRNRRLGELIGAGKTAKEAHELMAAEGETAEGYGALRHGARFVNDLGMRIEEELPLFAMLSGVVSDDLVLEGAMRTFVESCGKNRGRGRGARPDSNLRG
jgi:glycerol-3-phosphate dehydrogenase (NAD(P)+)